MSTTDLVLIGLSLLILAAAIAYWIFRPRPTQPKHYTKRSPGCTPNAPTPYGSSYITDAYYYLIDQLLALEPGSQNGGVYANKPGYHNSRSQNSSTNYSVVDRPPDDGGPSTVASAIDWTFPEAQRGDYSRISIYTSRLLASAKDPNDPRLNGWREFYGQSDWDSNVEGWDCRYGYSVTSDSSHLWHIHLSESRDKTQSHDNKNQLLSVLRGEPWPPIQQSKGDGAVLLNCPYDADRLDLLYVSSNGEVWHAWWSGGGINALWTAQGIKQENLKGLIVPGTLTASWAYDQSGINITGLGAPDEGNCPADCGNYWAYFLGRNGVKSGWGSVSKVYGQYPTEGWQANIR